MGAHQKSRDFSPVLFWKPNLVLCKVNLIHCKMGKSDDLDWDDATEAEDLKTGEKEKKNVFLENSLMFSVFCLQGLHIGS